METVRKNISRAETEVRDDFNLGAAITVMLILLMFIAASFYVLISSYMEIN
ncbi:hypothetical protein OCK74_05995 [Chitinophagaceae bacterium LB-8]|uniref:Uncharacterized protein n=1 Tax=Paraflavisolibacter caeni TaxID=2982496 RepID=A0A9X2XT23_9BACT|nr:hypothetical protein [Paraflavisolibacter caeni]MCU7548659.1 hypothetical protein [Paraflavisolibacter caeni]